MELPIWAQEKNKNNFEIIRKDQKIFFPAPYFLPDSYHDLERLTLT